MTDREKFERSMKERFDWIEQYTNFFDIDEHGEYADATAEMMWAGWQARQPEIDTLISERDGATALLDQYELDWNRLLSGDYRALNPEKQIVFEKFKHINERAEKAEAEVARLREPNPGLVGGLVAVSSDPRYAGWVFVRHADSEHWTTGAKLTPETWAMIERAALKGE